MRGKLVGLFILVIFGSQILLGCGAGASGAATSTPAVPVKSSGDITAEGEVVPIQYAALTFTVSGVISEVLVKEGEHVNADQVIARLDGKERFESAVASSELGVLSAQQTLNDLNKNAEVKQANAKKVLADAEKAYQDALDERERMGLRWGNQDTIDRAYANLVVTEQAVKDAEKNFEEYGAWRTEDDLVRANFLSLLASARIARDRAQAQFDYVKAAPDELELNKSDSRAGLAKANMEKARVDWGKLKNGIDPDDLALAEAKLKDAQTKLESAKAALDDLDLKAPFAGTVVANNLKVGEVAAPTSAQVTIADMSTWKIETTDLTELNVVGIKDNSPVSVTFDAIPDVELKGKVERIKTLGVNKQGDITYTVIVALDQTNDQMRWKMTASVGFERQ